MLRLFSRDSEICVVDGQKNAWGKMKMANGKKAVSSKEMGLKKTSKVSEVLRSTLKNKINSKETVIQKLINTDLVGNQSCPIILKKNLSVSA